MPGSDLVPEHRLSLRYAAARVARRSAAPAETMGSIPHGRDHGGGDHPVPFRTRQLSPPSPRVLRISPWEGRESRPWGMLRVLRGGSLATHPAGLCSPSYKPSGAFSVLGVDAVFVERQIRALS